MLGATFLPFHISRYGKRNVKRFSRSFDLAESIGLVCSYKTMVEGSLIDEFQKKLRSLDKKVSILVFHENSSKTEEISNSSFSKRDLNFFGIWTKPKVKDFTARKFDYLINLDLCSNIFVHSVLAESNAHCRVGVYADSSRAFLELMVKPQQKSLTYFLEAVEEMLIKIRNDE
ncbi:MAG: hypothetical protein RJQ09_00850 [Cyclobacteriaceae bacterium]